MCLPTGGAFSKRDFELPWGVEPLNRVSVGLEPTVVVAGNEQSKNACREPGDVLRSRMNLGSLRKIMSGLWTGGTFEAVPYKLQSAKADESISVAAR
jgi:hypothetical protein